MNLLHQFLAESVQILYLGLNLLKVALVGAEAALARLCLGVVGLEVVFAQGLPDLSEPFLIVLYFGEGFIEIQNKIVLVKDFILLFVEEGTQLTLVKVELRPDVSSNRRLRADQTLVERRVDEHIRVNALLSVVGNLSEGPLELDIIGDRQLFSKQEPSLVLQVDFPLFLVVSVAVVDLLADLETLYEVVVVRSYRDRVEVFHVVLQGVLGEQLKMFHQFYFFGLLFNLLLVWIEERNVLRLVNLLYDFLIGILKGGVLVEGLERGLQLSQVYLPHLEKGYRVQELPVRLVRYLDRRIRILDEGLVPRLHSGHQVFGIRVVKDAQLVLLRLLVDGPLFFQLLGQHRRRGMRALLLLGFRV